MRVAMMSDLLTEVLIPVASVVGIFFSLLQWYFVSKVKLSPERQTRGAHDHGKNGYSDRLIEEEEGINDHNVVVKCAEIQNAISEGENFDRARLWTSFYACLSHGDLIPSCPPCIPLVVDKINTAAFCFMSLFFITIFKLIIRKKIVFSFDSTLLGLWNTGVQ